MGKHEPPPFRMKVENGRLVPAAAWDQERLLTYRNGSYLSVHITQQKNRKLERKYWAILHKVIDTCGVKWRVAEDAHKAIRWAVGAVEPFLTADGKMRAELKSTSTMEDPEYGLFYQDAMEFLHRLTGVDPETLGAEAADVGEDDHQTSEDADPLPGGTDEGSDGQSLPSTVAADLPADAADQEGGAPVMAEPDKQDHGDPAAPPSTYSRADCIKAFLRTATDDDLDVKAKRALLEEMKDWWKAALANDLDFVKTCLSIADKVAKGEQKEAGARKYLEAIPEGGA